MISKNVVRGLAILAMAAAAQARASDVGVHVGAAVPLFQVAPQVKTVGSDFFSVAAPIGFGVHLTDRLVFDLETVVGTPIRPTGGTTSLTVDPGVVYNWGPFATGARIAFDIGSKPNVGMIALINKGFPVNDKLTWFIEGAFPMSIQDGQASMKTVLHTGFAF
jgi:hypothetical protein